MEKIYSFSSNNTILEKFYSSNHSHNSPFVPNSNERYSFIPNKLSMSCFSIIHIQYRISLMSCISFPVIITLGGNLVQIVQLVIYFHIVVIPFISQVPQAVMSIVTAKAGSNELTFAIFT